jgi:hypothetical protein
VAVLYAPDAIPDKVVLISPEGSLSTYNSDLQHSESESTPSGTQKLLFSFIFDTSRCSFACGGQVPHLNRAIVVTVLKRRKETSVRVCSIEQTAETIGEMRVKMPERVSSENPVPCYY